MQCVGPVVHGDENMNGAGEQVDILPPNCLVKERWKVVSVCLSLFRWECVHGIKMPKVSVPFVA